MSDILNSEQLYEDAKTFLDFCWSESNTRRAMSEFADETEYQAIDNGMYRAVFYREDLAESDAVVKFPSKIHAPEESMKHNLDEYRAWESMTEEMSSDFAEVLDCGQEGNYLVQRKSEGKSLLGAFKLMVKYHYSDYPSGDLGFSNIGIVDGESVITDYAWGSM